MANMGIDTSVPITALRSGRLSLWAVVALGFTVVAPTFVLAGLFPTAWSVTGVVQLTAIMAVLSTVLAGWGVGFTQVIRCEEATSGGLYSVIAHGLGRGTGLVCAGVQILAYSLLQVALFGILGPLIELMGFPAPWWMIDGGVCLVIAVLGMLGIGVSARIVQTIALVELAFLGLLITIYLSHPADGHMDLAALDPRGIGWTAVGVAAAICAAALVGAESLPVYGRETRTARDILLGIPTVVVLMGVVYTLGSLALTISVGPTRITEAATQLGTDLLFAPAATHWGGDNLILTGRWLLALSVAGALLSYHHVVARGILNLAVEMGWSWLGRINHRHGSPLGASLTQSTLGLAAIVVCAGMGWDPMITLFYLGGVLGGFGIFTLITVSAAASVAYFLRHRQHRHGRLWSTQVVPALAALCLGALVALMAFHFDTLLGVGATDPRRWAPALYAIPVAIGVLGVLRLRRRDPNRLARVGFGPDACTLT